MKAILKDTGEAVNIISYGINGNWTKYVDSKGESIESDLDYYKGFDHGFEYKKYDLFKSILSAMIGNKSMDLYSEDQHNEIIKTSLNITDKALKALNK